ncbi:MAG: hypothetical protein ACJAUL_003789, partial [Paraglaciecola sp.]
PEFYCSICANHLALTKRPHPQAESLFWSSAFAHLS